MTTTAPATFALFVDGAEVRRYDKKASANKAAQRARHAGRTAEVRTADAAPADPTDAELIAAIERSVELGEMIQVTPEWLAAQADAAEADEDAAEDAAYEAYAASQGVDLNDPAYLAYVAEAATEEEAAPAASGESDTRGQEPGAQAAPAIAASCFCAGDKAGHVHIERKTARKTGPRRPRYLATLTAERDALLAAAGTWMKVGAGSTQYAADNHVYDINKGRGGELWAATAEGSFKAARRNGTEVWAAFIPADCAAFPAPIAS